MNTVEYQTLLEIRNATHRAAQAGKNTVPVELYREQQKELARAQAYIAALQGQLADTKAQLKTAEDRARLNALNLDIQTGNLEKARAYFRPKVARLEEENAALKQQLADKA